MNRRKSEHLYQSRQDNSFAIHKAIKKYGEESFEWSIIDTADNQEELDEKELYWIEKYDTYGVGGYNMTVGGQFTKSDGSNGDDLSLMSGGRRFFVFDLDGQLIREAISQTNFAKEIGVGVTTVNNVLLGIKNSTKDMILIFEEEFSEDSLNEIVNRVKVWSGEFVVFDKSDSFIGRWSSRRKCNRDTGFSPKSIQRQLVDNSPRESCRKYKVYYLDDVPENLKLLVK